MPDPAVIRTIASARGPLRATPWTRLHFAWAVAWTGLVTPPLALGLLAHNLVSPTARTFKGWMTVWSRVVLAGTGIRLRVEVAEPLPEAEPIVVVANHQNMLDILTCAAGIPHPYGFAAKAELRRAPIVGAVLARSACLFVDKSSARRAAESIREAGALIRRGNSVLMYPEGERTYGPEMTDFQRGAFVLAAEAGVPVVPVVQPDNYAVLDERRRISRPGTVRLLVGVPVPTAHLPRREAPALAEAVRQRMLQMLAEEGPVGDATGEVPRPSVSSAAPEPGLA
jgi:1-acyl-sn-glycerol-3-phosphate acyltransferase